MTKLKQFLVLQSWYAKALWKRAGLQLRLICSLANRWQYSPGWRSHTPCEITARAARCRYLLTYELHVHPEVHFQQQTGDEDKDFSD